MNLLSIAFLVFLLNLPFGYMRAASEKYSKKWFIYIHAPIPFVVALRLLSGLGFELYTFPVMIFAFFLGQFVGGFLRRVRV
ncbi:hypothetical protein [Hippea maritima]|uniref:Uncharacterized protein n=1 Tax=Hippea maritima (strain ATCC 700847 / DSM 10411 / MH2) TaxID=760142 RepID=F2LXY5_HIPMA|nr:hypothetical protein [Hippea maritima]AEA33250.1 hypothetical protein Hipma_0273 [Hippea maritima DSM 10411]